MASLLEDDLVGVARGLLEAVEDGRDDARRRRAVSTAYYAVFHALCRVCADKLVGARSPEHREAIYRTVEHGAARKLLTSTAARQISPNIEKLGGYFADLQRNRHAADYRPQSAEPIVDEAAQALLQVAELSLFIIDLLTDEEELALAVLLISRPRSS